MTDVILTINAGSSSIKFAVYETPVSGPVLCAKGQVEGIGTAPHFMANDGGAVLLAESYWEPDRRAGAGHGAGFRQIWQWLSEFVATGDRRLAAVGHRVAHGGQQFTHAVRIDDQVTADLTRLIPLAPLHQPHNVAGIRAVSGMHPKLPQVACFDTAFHRDRPAVSERFGLPFPFYEEGVRRFGFHGLSYEYIVSRLEQVAPNLARGRVVVAHLGSGCSMCAVREGKSIETTMSFSSLDGLPMGTRCGTLDPGVLLYLMRRERLTVDDLEDLLYKQSGLLGISGISNDMRALQQSDDARARDAVDYFVYRIGCELGALAAVLGGLDGLVFTAGVGENDRSIRERVCRNAAWLGIELDADANQRGECRISRGDRAPSVWVIPTDEERMIALHTRRLADPR